jgi:hypothetical protein
VRSRNPGPVTRRLGRIGGSVHQAILADNSPHRQRRQRGLATRRPLVQPLVWPCLVVVLNELLEHVLQVASTPDQQVVQALAPGCPHPPRGE